MRTRWKWIAIAVCCLLNTTAGAADYKGKKILVIDSYHEGYAWSDSLRAGVKSVLGRTSATVKFVLMDTKRNNDEAFKKTAGEKVKAEIEAFKPDVVIAADDNASKYVVMPFYKDAALPFVFCGLNWDASIYGMPYKNTTGMIEVAPLKELLDQLKKLAKGNRVGFVAADNETIKKEVDGIQKILKINAVVKLAKTADEWKKAIASIQPQVDVLIVGNTAGLVNWTEEDGMKFLLANTKVPSGAYDDHMAKFAMIGFTKLAEEQGSFAATAALKILDGAAPSSIPIAKNKEGRLTVNLKIAQALGITVPYEIIRAANEVIQ